MTDIVPTADATPAIASPQNDVPATWVAAMKLAGRIHDTPFVPKAIRGQPHIVLACILYGEEVDIGPMQSLNSINVIEGRPSASPELMRALVGRAGHKLTVDESTVESVTLTGTRKDTGATASVTWTLADAVRAGLCTIKDGKPYARSSSGKRLPWEAYPRAMLLARATSELCRALFADVVSGLSYTPEEAMAIESGTWDPEPGELVDPLTTEAHAAIGPAPVDPVDAVIEQAAHGEPAAPEWDADDPNDPTRDDAPPLPELDS